MDFILKKIVGSSFGKILAINLQRGDLLLECIMEQAKEEDIKFAVVMCGIGTLEMVSFHRVKNTDTKPDDEYFTLKKPFELASLQGLIIDGVPHLHFVISDLEKTYAAHLEPGTTVLYTAEILLAEIKGIDDLIRRKTSIGIPEFYKKKSDDHIIR